MKMKSKANHTDFIVTRFPCLAKHIVESFKKKKKKEKNNNKKYQYVACVGSFQSCASLPFVSSMNHSFIHSFGTFGQAKQSRNNQETIINDRF